MTAAAEAAALRQALEANGRDLIAYFENRLSDRQDAADLLSETAMAAWRRIDALPCDDATRQRMWLFGIARFVLGNHRRSRRRRSALVERLRESLRAAPVVVADPATTIAVRDAVDRLKDEQRELMLLVHWDGFSVTEAADLLDLNPSTARSRYAAARAELRSALFDLEGCEA
ncbi:RNA polymerase sigma factor [Nocardioides sp. Iso805N]|uniref:RNA polymerase sigma factor n=1 Tax=Nocardioides sp. Iso805N TaxID=1283287 RepID=UPI00037C7B10|nr:sigma-70 family RNA polymerase sigma factor [Nocardioides sp. Iso805N]